MQKFQGVNLPFGHFFLKEGNQCLRSYFLLHYRITTLSHFLYFCHLEIINLKYSIMAVAITSENFDSLVKGDKLVVIDFWAQWCGPCKALAPTIEELATEYEGKAVIGKCDVDENNDLAVQFGVMNIPMLVFVKNGELVDTLVGRVPKDEIAAKINAHL